MLTSSCFQPTNAWEICHRDRGTTLDLNVRCLDWDDGLDEASRDVRPGSDMAWFSQVIAVVHWDSISWCRIWSINSRSFRLPKRTEAMKIAHDKMLKLKNPGIHHLRDRISWPYFWQSITSCIPIALHQIYNFSNGELNSPLISDSCWMIFMFFRISSLGIPGRRCTVWVRRVCCWVPSCYGLMMQSRQLELMGGFSWNLLQKKRMEERSMAHYLSVLYGLMLDCLGGDVWLFLHRLKVKNRLIRVNSAIFTWQRRACVYKQVHTFILDTCFFHFSSFHEQYIK